MSDCMRKSLSSDQVHVRFTLNVVCLLIFFFLAGQKNWTLWNRTVYTGSDKKD